MADAPVLLALDFDGVICDSASETGLTTWRAYRELWPREAGTGDDPAPAELVAAYRRLRPIIESGWENYVLLRLVEDGVPEDEIADGFQERWCPEVLERYHLDRDDLIARFAAARDDWIERDPAGWAGCQGFYPGVTEALARWLAEDRLLYVITTKQARFADLLLRGAGIEIAEGRLLGMESGPKTDSLVRLSGEHGIEPSRMWFVEDRMRTLERAATVEALDGLGLFLVDWGYNTPDEREAARAHVRIRLLGLEQFTGPFECW